VNPDHWLIHRVRRRRQGAVDVNGDPIDGKIETIKGLVEHRRRSVRTAEGHDVVISATLWTTSEPRATDTYWLPGPDLSTAPPSTSDQGRSPATIQGAQTLSGRSVKAWIVTFG
jgi:hypothetical protein